MLYVRSLEAACLPLSSKVPYTSLKVALISGEEAKVWTFVTEPCIVLKGNINVDFLCSLISFASAAAVCRPRNI